MLEQLTRAAREAQERRGAGYVAAAEIDWEVSVRAVLEAMREPTPEMIDAAAAGKPEGLTPIHPTVEHEARARETTCLADRLKARAAACGPGEHVLFELLTDAAKALASSNPEVERLREARETAIEEAARACANICRRAGEALQDGPIGPNGWPETPEGAARHQSFALADSIEESLQHERLRALAGGERGDD